MLRLQTIIIIEPTNIKMDKTYIVNGTKLEVIMTLVGQSQPSQGYRYRWGICLTTFQLWDNPKLGK